MRADMMFDYDAVAAGTAQAWPRCRPEPLNRGLQVTDKRRAAWQKRATRMKKGRSRSVCREVSCIALAA
jgi:hypothetical protein